MKLVVKILHFVDGINQLGGAMSVAVGKVTGGPRAMESITRIPGGYLIGYGTKLYVVEAAQVRCAEVIDADAEEPKPVQVPKPEPTQPAPPTVPIGGLVVLGGVETSGGNAVTVDGRGVYSRAVPAVQEATADGPPPEPVVHTVRRQERSRRVGPEKS